MLTDYLEIAKNIKALDREDNDENGKLLYEFSRLEDGFWSKIVHIVREGRSITGTPSRPFVWKIDRRASKIGRDLVEVYLFTLNPEFGDEDQRIKIRFPSRWLDLEIDDHSWKEELQEEVSRNIALREERREKKRRQEERDLLEAQKKEFYRLKAIFEPGG